MLDLETLIKSPGKPALHKDLHWAKDVALQLLKGKKERETKIAEMETLTFYLLGYHDLLHTERKKKY